MDFSARIEKLETEKRRRAITWCRFRCGAVALAQTPWKLIFPVLLVVLFTVAWRNQTAIPRPGSNGNPALAELWSVVIALLLLTLFVLSALGLLAVLGTPFGASRVDTALLHVGLTDRYGFPPALVSCRRVKHTGIKCLTFLSRGISLATWEKKQADIEDRLNAHCVENIKYGGKNNNNRIYVVLTVAPGVGAGRAEPLYDDEL